MASAGAKKGPELRVTQEELERIQKAMKNEEFRKLFQEYAEELADPKQRELYEKEIEAMEAQKGRNVKFFTPEPGFVIKVFEAKKNKKIMINICKCDNVRKPSSKRTNDNGKVGVVVTLPHTIDKGRMEKDQMGNVCEVFDVIFHPHAISDSQVSKKMKQSLVDSAFDAVERISDIKLNRESVKFPKKRYYGTVKSVLMEEEKLDESTQEGSKESSSKVKDKDKSPVEAKPVKYKPKKMKPDYKIIHRGYIDYEDYTIGSTKSSRPKELVLTIDLPKCDSAKELALDVTVDHVVLTSSDYCLRLKLPYKVDEDLSEAKFDKKKRQLIVVLLVLPPLQPKNAELKTEELMLPEFTHWQDENSVTVVALVEGVEEGSIETDFKSTVVSLRFSCGSPCKKYSVCVKAPPSTDLSFLADGCTSHVTEDRVILQIAKGMGCCSLWNAILVGQSFDSMQEVLFLTKSNLSSVGESVEEEKPAAADVEVVTTFEEPDTIKIEFKENRGNEAEEQKKEFATSDNSIQGTVWPVTEYEVKGKSEDVPAADNVTEKVETLNDGKLSQFADKNGLADAKDVDLECKLMLELDS